MIKKIEFSKKFNKKISKFTKKLKIKTFEKFKVFKLQPFEKSLNNHKLTWNRKWFSSINITWDIRAIFREVWEWNYEFVEFENIWSHSDLYK